MQRIKFLAPAALFILVAGVFFSSQAQKKMAIHRIMPPVPVSGVLSGTYLTTVSATEISTGTPNEISNEVYGWTSQGTTTGDLSGYIFLSIDYTLPIVSIDPGDFTGSVAPASNVITGGSWSKLIFVDGVYQGSVSGRILSGSMVWNEKSHTKAIELKLTGDSGTDAFDGSVGMGSFEGTVDANGKSGTTISGTLTLNY